MCLHPIRTPVKSLPVLNSALAGWDSAAFIHTSTEQGSGPQPGICRVGGFIAESLLGQGASPRFERILSRQRPLSRWRRIRSTTRGSAIKETIRMRAPQLHRRGSASKIFLIKRAHVLRASWKIRIVLPGRRRFCPSVESTEIRARWRMRHKTFGNAVPGPGYGR